MKRKIIGEGAYGCVHKPSIQCKTSPKPNFDYGNYVSKIMKTTNAEQELSEFVAIGNIDPSNDYHLGPPILCKPDLDEPDVKDNIKDCKHIKIDDIDAHPDKYSLLVMKFGGHDLKGLCNKYLEKYLETNKESKTDKFWLEVHHLIKGLKFFKDNGIVHNDIKPQNILFNTNTGKLKYIDFGLMRTKKKIIETSKKNKNNLAIFHWSYPFDCGFMNIIPYKKYIISKKNKIEQSLSNMIVLNSKDNPYELPINHPNAFSILFTYINPDNTIPNASTQYGYIKSFFDGFNKLIDDDRSHDVMLNRIIDSIDVFGLGFTLQFIANCFKRLNALSLDEFTRLSILFHKMYDFNPSTRVIDIDILLNDYENVLLENGVLTRLKKNFENNVLVNKPPAPSAIITESKSDDNSRPQHLSTALQELANEDPIKITAKCPETKELNPLTNRCVNKCKELFSRNEKFKCVKHISAKIKTIKSKTVKICPSDKELNPKTQRCVNKCKEGFSRNKQFQCKKIQTRKQTISKSSARRSRSRSSSSGKTSRTYK